MLNTLHYDINIEVGLDHGSTDLLTLSAWLYLEKQNQMSNSSVILGNVYRRRREVLSS